ncbi:hydrogenase formation protein HypD [Legionella jordanis]|uniref:hydrogenase formation protein HypD n=1 Tax=Legionella jordanis TaxID=456 RepID=UPI000F000CB9|nr:hydrogenase formation protein HypD [Legionella jordanis]RMX15130.1 hydrogenase formation protein HypD [Legionella jordanis]
MKYIEEFRNSEFAKVLIDAIKKEAMEKSYRFMEFCGGHTHAIHRYGLPSLLPAQIEMVHGPGCPVCVLPISRIDQAIALASISNVILCSYADMLRVPGSNQQSLLQCKANGADVRMLYSVDDALQVAKKNPHKEVIFFAIGFETTTAPTAFAILKAKKMGLSNFTVFCNHVLTPVAMDNLLHDSHTASSLTGFVGPAHVSIIIGSKAYENVSKKYQKPVVIAGFEPLDVLHAILMLIRQMNEKRCEVEIQYSRAVSLEGNFKSQQMIQEVFELRESFGWRGLGQIPESAWQIKTDYASFDAEKRFELPEIEGIEHKQCDCSAILKGLKKPVDCKLFAKACTPQNPLGACMVSSEGACAAVYAYGRAL